MFHKNEIHWMIALHCLETSRGNLQNMFSDNRCYKTCLLCTGGRNHPKKYIYNSVAGLNNLIGWSLSLFAYITKCISSSTS